MTFCPAILSDFSEHPVAQPTKATATTSALSKRGATSNFVKETLIVSEIWNRSIILLDSSLNRRDRLFLSRPNRHFYRNSSR